MEATLSSNLTATRLQGIQAATSRRRLTLWLLLNITSNKPRLLGEAQAALNAAWLACAVAASWMNAAAIQPVLFARK